MSEVASWLAALAGVWLIAVGFFMAAAPRKALSVLAAMGGTPSVHFGEMAVRGVAGLLLILAAPASRLPGWIAFIGWFLVVSALALALLPRRWHSRYSRWWAKEIPPVAVRLIAPVSILGGSLLIGCLI
ncbi:hypothetical protein [uncultured Brevundimonas sp.]|uniref:hypothetical protein n=1 Tax=uncultured Brevundimonas sp. TaxID=213418 RepID=UPI002623CE90|nr:hypothetical protein [uncultured Brevundimonas sp.]